MRFPALGSPFPPMRSLGAAMDFIYRLAGVDAFGTDLLHTILGIAPDIGLRDSVPEIPDVHFSQSEKTE